MVGGEETVDDAEFLQFFSDAQDPFLTTSEVAEHFDFSSKGARKRLYKLADNGYLNYKKAGNAPVFWITEEGEQYLQNN